MKLSLTEVFNDGTSATLDSENACDFENDVYGHKSAKVHVRESMRPTLWSSPARYFAGEPYADNLWCFEFPRQVGHDIDSVSSSDTYSSHSKPPRIGGMTVRPNHQAAGESIVLENDLVNDARARFPEANIVFCAGSGQEVIHFFVDVDCALQVLNTTGLGLDKVIAVYSGWRGH